MSNDTNRPRKLTPKEAARFILAVRRVRRMQLLSDCFRATAPHSFRHNAILDLAWRRSEVDAWRRPIHELWSHIDMAERRRWRRLKPSQKKPLPCLPWSARKR